MNDEREEARRWWCFDTRDLLLLTAIVAVSVTVIQIFTWVLSAPNWVIAARGLPLIGVVVGGLTPDLFQRLPSRPRCRSCVSGFSTSVIRYNRDCSMVAARCFLVGKQMANPEHVEILKQGAEKIREWWAENPDVALNLSGANHRNANLRPASASTISRKATRMLSRTEGLKLHFLPIGGQYAFQSAPRERAI